jgi:predicted AAA+ superfamily ATPase
MDLPKKRSAFLWGPRKTGKSSYLKQHFSQSITYDLLNTGVFFELSTRPALLREQLLRQSTECLSRPIILDEVQKIPALLDEVHGLIENHGLRFILCGSSARKLVRGHANLLGGRAWRYELFPFSFVELKNFTLLRALNQGLIPSHYLEDPPSKKTIRSYIQDYLKEEVFAEGLTRNIPAFSRFLDAVGYTHGELVNYKNIASDCGVDAKTVKEYFQILVDTLLGSLVEPFHKRQGRDTINATPKFYLFDVGVAGELCRRTIEEPRGEQFGKAFEHFILMELRAYRSYKDCNFGIQFWRTKTGAEVDFILGHGEVAVEIKGATRIDGQDMKSLRLFTEKYRPKRSIIVCNETQARVHDNITVLPWRDFLNELWEGKIIT